jgi:hypothetical protein
MARTKRLAILALAVLVLGGCGGSSTTPTGSGGTTQRPSGVATPSSAPTASPTANLAALASQYTSIASQGNDALVQCNKDKTAAVGGSLTKLQAAAQECLNAYTPYIAAFEAVNWGPAQPQADKVIAAINKILTLTEQMVNATDETTFTAAYDQLASAATDLRTAANVLRAALGLPPSQL